MNADRAGEFGGRRRPPFIEATGWRGRSAAECEFGGRRRPPFIEARSSRPADPRRRRIRRPAPAALH